MANKLSYNDIRALLSIALRGTSKTADFWICDLTTTRVIYQDYQSDRYYSRSYSIDAKTNAVTLGKAEEVRQRTTYETVAPASFNLEPDSATTGELVLRSGKLFEIGDYPDKQFSLDLDEAQQAIAAFYPVPVDLEHRSTPLDGKLGQLQHVALADDNRTIVGTVALPKWLDEALGDAARRVSLTWNRATKTIAGIALTNTPRVADAALFAAFSDATGETIPTPTFTEEPDRMETTPAQKPARFPRLQALIASLLPSGSQDAAASLVAAFADEEPAAQPANDQAAAFSQAATEQIAQLQQQLAAERRQRIENDAAAFATEQIAANKATPAEREALVAAFAQAATDDQAHGLVTFSDADGNTGSRSRQDGLRAIYDARPAHQLTEELVADQDGVLFAANEAKDPNKPSADRVAELASKTTLGQAAFSQAEQPAS